MGQYHGKYSFDTFTHEKSVFYKPADWNLPVCYPPFTKGKMNLVKFFLSNRRENVLTLTRRQLVY